MITSAASDGVRTIEFDRPAKRNALTSDALAELRAVVEAATEPVVLLRGAGAAFCAGADLEEVAALAGGDEAEAFARLGQDVARTMAAYDGAVVAGIDGAARGGGVELALACDVRVCTARSTFAEPGVAIGLFGAWGGTARLPAVVGPGAAMDLALSGRIVDADEARRIGLVSRVVDDPETVAREIAANDERAVRTVADLVGAGPEGAGHDEASHDAALAAREQRERAAFVALIESGRPIRKG